jgi:hypothetical protein
MRFSRPAACVALALAALAPSRAGATNPDAQTFFAQGRKYRLDGDCDKAITAFRHALESAPEGLGALRNIAECEEQLGRFASARIDWFALRRAAMETSDAKYEGWDKDAADRYAKLEGRVGKLVVHLRGEHLERVKVTLDGQPLDPRLIGVELERDLGEHRIEAAYGAAEPIVSKSTLRVGAVRNVDLDIPSEKAGGAPPAPGDAPSNGHAMRNAGFVLVGFGGLAAIGLATSIGLRQSALSSVSTKCPNYASGQVCPSGTASDVSLGTTTSTMVNVFTAFAIAGLGVGIPLAVIGSNRSAAPAAAAPAPVALFFSSAGGGASVRAMVSF